MFKDMTPGLWAIGTVVLGCIAIGYALQYCFHPGLPAARVTDRTTVESRTCVGPYEFIVVVDKPTGARALVVNYSSAITVTPLPRLPIETK